MKFTVYKCNHEGAMIWEYEGKRIDGGENWIRLNAHFNRPDTDLGFVNFRFGDLFVEWFYSDRWYNIFQVHEGDGPKIKGWYCNITRPATITESEVWSDDLALDVFVTPNGSVMLVDEEEFSDLNLPTDERMAALRAVEAIRRAVNAREEPFDKIRADLT
jgi:hypothetical protein